MVTLTDVTENDSLSFIHSKATYNGFGHESLRHLPEDHRKLISEFEIIYSLDGYFRIFGLEGGDHPGLKSWNATDTWKYTWPHELVDDYIFFAEIASGHQFAYKKSLLARGDSSVFALDPTVMIGGRIVRSFQEFFDKISLFVRTEEMYEEAETAKHKYETIGLGLGFTYYPPVVITNEEPTIETLRVEKIADLLTMNGDYYSQCPPVLEGSVQFKVDHYVDERGRKRAKVRFY